MSEFKHGDRVLVTDPALAKMREIMRNATGREPAPNHHGTVCPRCGQRIAARSSAPTGRSPWAGATGERRGGCHCPQNWLAMFVGGVGRLLS